MKEDDFSELVTSIKEAGAIKRGIRAPSRAFEIGSVDIKAVRKRLRRSQSEFALMTGVSVATLIGNKGDVVLKSRLKPC